jgi:hypothetical protein
MRILRRYKKFLAALLAGAVVLVASIPTDADPKIIAAGQIVTALAVLLAPRNATPVSREDLKRTVGPTRFAGPEDRRRFGGGP